jgi:hypothetical protein
VCTALIGEDIFQIVKLIANKINIKLVVSHSNANPMASLLDVWRVVTVQEYNSVDCFNHHLDAGKREELHN